MLVVEGVEGGDLPLAEGVVEGVVNRDRHDAQSSSLDVAEDRGLAHGVDELVRPIIQGLQVAARERVLIQALAEASTHADVLDGLEKEVDALDAGDFATQSGDDNIDRDFALVEGLEGDEHAAVVDGGIAGVGPDERAEIGHGRVVKDDARDLSLELGHGGEGNVLGCLGDAHHATGVLLGEEPARHHGVEPKGGDQGSRRHHQHKLLMAEDPMEPRFIVVEHPVKPGFAGIQKPAGFFVGGFRLKKPGAEHGGEGEGNDSRHENRGAEGDGKLMEKAPDQTTHEQQRDEHRHKGGAHGNNGEADLPGALDGRGASRLPFFNVAHHVLDHHNRVIHHETDGNRDGHERKVVQAIVAGVHDGEGAGQGERDGDARDEGGPEAPQEHKNHHHHQSDAQEQRKLDVRDGSFDGGGAVVENGDFDGGREPLLDLGEDVPDALNGFNDVRPGLLLDNHKDGGVVVGPSRHQAVLDRGNRLAERVELDRRAAFLREDQRIVALGLV